MKEQIAKDQWLRDNALQVLDAVVDSIIAMDEQGIIQYANGATYRMLGYEPGSLVGTDVTALMPEPHRSAHQGYIDKYLKTGKPSIIGIGRELIAVSKEGRQIPIYLAVSDVRGPAGVFFAGILRDLTQQKQAQAAMLEQQERLARVGRLSMMGEMTASIAHEINQPLTAISMYAQACLKLLQVPNLDREKIGAALEKLSRQSLRAGTIIERIQRFVRNEDGQRERCSVRRLVGDIVQFAQSDAHLHGMELTFDIGDGLPDVFCDPVQVQQVTLNLIRNAFDVMRHINREHGNRVTVRCRKIDSWVEVAVEDAGTGVSVEDAPLLFSAFHTTKKDGMGMGLSICRSIIKLHDGEIGFFNNPTHGATFYFRLPTGEQQQP